MEFKIDFQELIQTSIDNEQYVGLGNPNAKILFVGKEAGIPIGKTIIHGSGKSWEEKKIDYSERFMAKDNLRDYRHTWQKYQKVYDQILDNLDTKDSNKKNYEITFVENVFTTELSNLGAPTTNEAKQLAGFRFQLKKRKDVFWRSEFIQNFPIILITASDDKYIETYPGEVCELFNVNFQEQVICGKSDKMWIHYSKSDKPKLLIHTRQLTNGASNDLLEKVSWKIAEFIKENSIKINIANTAFSK